MIIYTCKEVIPVSEKKEKSDNAKTWLIGALTDLIIGIILLIIDKLLN